MWYKVILISLFVLTACVPLPVFKPIPVTPVTVYVFDGGIRNHPELENRLRIGFDAFPGGVHRVCNNHGTAVAGAIAGKTVGKDTTAQIVDVKILDCEKMKGTLEAIQSAADWTITDHRIVGGPAVVNWSWIIDRSDSARLVIDSIVNKLDAEGIVVVAAAGNVDVDACTVSPTNSYKTISVGSVDSANVRAQHYTFGSCIDFWTRGEAVYLPNYDEFDEPVLTQWFGTSMAAGYISGTISQFLTTHPKALPSEVYMYLAHIADKNVVKDAQSSLTLLIR